MWLQFVIDDFQKTMLPGIIAILATISPIVLAFYLFDIFWNVWVRYIRAAFFYSQKYSLLEIRLPRDQFKSPLAMELFLTSIHNTSGEGTWVARFWFGKTRPWFSLEMASIEGQVKFFIWTRAKQKSFLESSLYAQFPGIEVHERDDYACSVHFDPDSMAVWACEFKLTKPNALPIKTYVDWGLDKDPKEEFKVDPLTPLIEFLGTLGPNQQIWIQILIRAHKNEQRTAGHLWKKTDAWQDEAKKLVNEILKRDPKSKVAGKFDEKSGRIVPPSISEGEREIVKAIERAVTKQPFDVGIRAIYFAQRDFFNGDNIGGVLGNWKQFSSESLNTLKHRGDKWHQGFDYPWEDYRDIRRNRMSRKVFQAYKRRSYFYPPFESKSFTLNTEELATIFHFPGPVAGTPTLERVPSKKGEAPSNLPV